MTPLRESMERCRPAAEERWEAALAPDTVLASQLGDEPLAAAQLQPANPVLWIAESRQKNNCSRWMRPADGVGEIKA